MLPYIFGHRGASGYEIENTIPSFQKAISQGAGIETDIQVTKDGKLICFHDLFFKIGAEYYYPNKLTFEELSRIKFNDNRKVPLLHEVFHLFKSDFYNFRYSFDIINRQVGIKLIDLALENDIIDSIEITDRRLSILSYLRKYNKSVKLVYTYIGNLKAINNRTINITKLRENQISTINLRCRKNIPSLFKEVITNNLNCYIWNVNTKKSMKKILKLNYMDKTVDAIYTNYPDTLIKLKEQLIG